MLRPKVVLWWGIGLSLASAVLSWAVPPLFYGAYKDGGAVGVDRGLLSILSMLVQAVTATLPVLGPALIAAAIVMAYLDRTVAGGRRSSAIDGEG